jgi:20S proteasome alpha/beta subunit
MSQNKNIQLNQLSKKRDNKMTCIIGAKCKDGAVLASDRKITYVDKPTEFRDKLHRDYYPIVTGGAGGSMVYDNFRHKLLPKLQPHQWTEIQVSGIIPMYSSSDISFFNYQNRIAEIVREVNDEETDENNKIELLTGIQTLDRDSKLTYITKEGYPTNGQLYKSIGTGAQYTYVFLKPFYDNEKDITMYKLTRLAYFIIRFIEKFNIDPCQGVGGKPQFWCIPNSEELFSDEDRSEWISQFEEDAYEMIENFRQNGINALLPTKG